MTTTFMSGKSSCLHLLTSLKGTMTLQAKKGEKQHLSWEGLNQRVQAVSDFLSKPWFTLPRYVQLRSKMEQFVKCEKV